jgi:hypothetical protein
MASVKNEGRGSGSSKGDYELEDDAAVLPKRRRTDTLGRRRYRWKGQMRCPCSRTSYRGHYVSTKMFLLIVAGVFFATEGSMHISLSSIFVSFSTLVVNLLQLLSFIVLIHPFHRSPTTPKSLPATSPFPLPGFSHRYSPRVSRPFDRPPLARSSRPRYIAQEYTRWGRSLLYLLFLSRHVEIRPPYHHQVGATRPTSRAPSSPLYPLP